MDDKTITGSKKGEGYLIGLIAGVVVSAGAVMAGPTGIAVLPTVLSFIAALTLGHQGAQAVHDVAKAKAGSNAVVNGVQDCKDKAAVDTKAT